MWPSFVYIISQAVIHSLTHRMARSRGLSRHCLNRNMVYGRWGMGYGIWYKYKYGTNAARPEEVKGLA